MCYAPGSGGATQRAYVPPDHSMESFHETSFNCLNPRYAYGQNNPPAMHGPGTRNYLDPEPRPQRDSIRLTTGIGRPKADTRDPNNKIYESSKEHVAKVGAMIDKQQQKFPAIASKLNVPRKACEEAYRQYRNSGQRSKAMILTIRTGRGRGEGIFKYKERRSRALICGLEMTGCDISIFVKLKERTGMLEFRSAA